MASKLKKYVYTQSTELPAHIEANFPWLGWLGQYVPRKSNQLIPLVGQINTVQTTRALAILENNLIHAPVFYQSFSCSQSKETENSEDVAMEEKAKEKDEGNLYSQYFLCSVNFPFKEPSMY